MQTLLPGAQAPLAAARRSHPGFRTALGAGLLFLAACGARAQITEVTETVAPGRFLVEMDAISVRLDRSGDAKDTVIALARTLLTTGLTSSWDLQFGADVFVSHKVTAQGASDRHTGLGDTFIRTKWRFLEENAAGVSAAVIPFAKIPSNTGGVGNGSLEAGMFVPFRLKLPAGLDFTAMGGVEFCRNDDDGYDARWSASAQAGVSATRALIFYAEVYVAKSTGGSPFDGMVGCGALYAVTSSLSWDVALYRGVSPGAADWNPVIRCNIGF